MMKLRKKIIGIDARMSGENCTGISRYIRELTSRLFEIDKINEYRLFLLEPEFSRFKVPVEKVKKIKVSSHWYSYREQIVLPWQMRRANCDLIHFPNFNLPIFYPKKYIVTIHDITPFFFSGHRRKSHFRDRAFRQVFQLAINRATKIIAVSQSTKTDIIKYFKVDPQKIEVVLNGLDQKEFKPAPLEALTDLQIKHNITKPFILYIGVWRNHKNVVGLLRAFKILLTKHKLDYQLVIGGKELPQYPEIRKTWQILGLEKNLILPGFISQAELPLFYQASKLLVIPSFKEGFGLTGLEALSCGTLITCSDIAPLREVFNTATTYFNPADPEEMAQKIYQLATDENLRAQKLANSHQLINFYDWQKTACQTLELYNQILHKNA